MKVTIEVDLKWFFFNQNNSGGHFIVDDNVAHVVFIQARGAEEARAIAHKILDESAQYYCSCCGERWDFDIYEEDGHDNPQRYRTPLSEMKSCWAKEEVRLHYFDGIVECLVLPDK